MYIRTESQSVSCSVMSDSLHDPMDSTPTGSSVHGILQARILEWVSFLQKDPFLQGVFPTRGWNPGPLHYRQILYHLSYQGEVQIKSVVESVILSVSCV